MSGRAASARSAALVGTCVLALAGPAAAPAPHAAQRASGAAVVVAHRGASGYAPENTLEAVDRAHALGAQWVENDVQRTRDGQLVVLHDTELKRTTDVEQVFPDRAPWRVGDFTAAEIARLDAGGWKGPAHRGARIPTLERYLERIEDNHQSLLMEIKSPELYPGIEGDILKELGRRGWLDRDHLAHRLVIQSFSAHSVQTVHRLRPDVKTGFLGKPPVAALPRYAAFADQINPDHATLTPQYVKAVHALRGAHGRPLETYVWTVDDAATARLVTGWGVDGVISNYPDVVGAAIGGPAD